MTLSTQKLEEETPEEDTRNDVRELRKVQFTVDKRTVDKLERSRDLNSDSSLAQTFRRSAAMLEFIDRMRHEGFEVLVKKGDEVYKIFIP